MIDRNSSEREPTTGEREVVGEMLSGIGDSAHDGSSREITDELTANTVAASTDVAFRVRTTVVSDFVDGQELPTAVTQSMIAVEGEDETILINIDEDKSDPEYGVALFVDFKALEKFDLENVKERDFTGHEVIIGAVKAAKKNKEDFKKQEQFWKKRFIAEIFKRLQI